MKTRDLIAKLHALDPTGDVECCVDGNGIIDVYMEPAYWDGLLAVMVDPYTMEFRAQGHKILLFSRGLSDAVFNSPMQFKVQFDPGVSAEKRADITAYVERLRGEAIDLMNRVEGDHFGLWLAKKTGVRLPRAEVYALQKTLGISHFSPITINVGKSYNDTRFQEWEENLIVRVHGDNIDVQWKQKENNNG